MKLLLSYFKGILKMVLPSVALFCILFFLVKDLYFSGIEPKQLIIYKDALFILLWVLSFLEIALFLIGGFLLLYYNKKEELYGFCLGALLISFYLLEMFRVYRHYWD